MSINAKKLIITFILALNAFAESAIGQTGEKFVEPLYGWRTNNLDGVFNYNSFAAALDAHMALLRAQYPTADVVLDRVEHLGADGLYYSLGDGFANGLERTQGVRYFATDNYGVRQYYAPSGGDIFLQLFCPIGFQLGVTWGSESRSRFIARCAPNYGPLPNCPRCKSTSVGNPINVEDRAKVETAADYLLSSGLAFSRHYSSRTGEWRPSLGSILVDRTGLKLADGVRGNSDSACLLASYQIRPWDVPELYCFPYVGYPTAPGVDISVYMPDGSFSDFNQLTGLSSSIGASDSLLVRQDQAGAHIGYERTDRDNVTEEFDATGRLFRRFFLDGKIYATTFMNSAQDKFPADAPTCPSTAFVGNAAGARVACVTEAHSGRQISFKYDQFARLVALVDASGREISYSYADAGSAERLGHGRLSSVTYQDGSVMQYVYSEPALIGGNVSLGLLTGIVDEKNARYATFSYSSSGDAIGTEYVGGVNRYSLASAGGESQQVTDPRGNQSVHNAVLISKDVAPGVTSYRRVTTGVMQPAGAGSASSSSQVRYDAQANVVERISLGNELASKNCYGYDLSRNLETVRLENVGFWCPTDVFTYVPVATARKVTTLWHPDWRLRTKVAEPRLITTYVYNGQPDPFNDNIVASCAPSAALLPNGKPIAVLCRQVEQASTDQTGAQGLATPLEAGVPNREQKWTYNQYGQVLTHDGPRTDVVDITTYTYYGDTSFSDTGSVAVGHTVGDLQSVTNATGQLAQYTKYDKHGQLLESVDANGVVTTNTYDLRQRPLSTSVGGQTTSYTYDPVGQLTRVTLPDGSWVGFEYDDAHRQTAMLDNRGNRIDYTLDNAGNRVAEQVKDPGGALKRQLARSIDALGRVQQQSGRP